MKMPCIAGAKPVSACARYSGPELFFEGASPGKVGLTARGFQSNSESSDGTLDPIHEPTIHVIFPLIPSYNKCNELKPVEDELSEFIADSALYPVATTLLERFGKKKESLVHAASGN